LIIGLFDKVFLDVGIRKLWDRLHLNIKAIACWRYCNSTLPVGTIKNVKSLEKKVWGVEFNAATSLMLISHCDSHSTKTCELLLNWRCIRIHSSTRSVNMTVCVYKASI
jgi:hypothetical protein